MQRTTVRVTLFCAITMLMSSALQADWLRFRGPNGSGVSDSVVPTEWSATKNLRWKATLPGPGSSSPVIVGDRVFVTCYSGYGLSQQDPGDQANLRRHLLCLSTVDGSVIWSKEFEPVLPEDEFAGMGVPQHGYATHTPVSDGQRIYTFFGKSGVYAFTLDGEQLWHKSVGTESDQRRWGSASSPIIHKDHLIVPATAESEAFVAFNKETGEEVWRQEASGFSGVWGSPVLVRVDDARTDLVIAVPGEMWALNPETGKLQWYCEALSAGSMCSSPIVDGNVVYAIEQGRGGGGGIAVQAGGKKDVTDSHVIWSGRQSSRIDTPVLYQGRLYSIANKIAQSYDAKTGEEIDRIRLRSPGQANSAPSTENRSQPPAGRGGAGRGGRGGRGGGFGNQDYTSPVVADGKIYFQSRQGECYVLSTGDGLKQLAVNRVTNDDEDFGASPAVSDGAIYLRSNGHLYCVAGN